MEPRHSIGSVVLLVATALTGLLSCATTGSPAANGVMVVRRSEDDGVSPVRLPSGCRLLVAHPAVDRTELDLATTELSRERERAAAAGANVLVAREKAIVPRRDYDCPASSPITDCPPSEGAWFRVEYEDYACPAEALGELRRSRR